jgi:hypothetical protein
MRPQSVHRIPIRSTTGIPNCYLIYYLVVWGIQAWFGRIIFESTKSIKVIPHIDGTNDWRIEVSQGCLLRASSALSFFARF